MFSLFYTVYQGCQGRLLSDTLYWHWSVPVAPGISLSKPYGMLHVTRSPAHLYTLRYGCLSLTTFDKGQGRKAVPLFTLTTTTTYYQTEESAKRQRIQLCVKEKAPWRTFRVYSNLGCEGASMWWERNPTTLTVFSSGVCYGKVHWAQG